MSQDEKRKELRPVKVWGGMTVRDLVAELRNSSFGARRVAEACDLVASWKERPGCRVILTVSGAMSVAQQGSVIAALIQQGVVHCVVTTGAVVTHSLTQESGRSRSAVREGDDDEALARQGLNRIFDTLESDEGFQELDVLVSELSMIKDTLLGPVSSAKLIKELGMSRRLSVKGMVGIAAASSVPLFVPALSDSELGLRIAAICDHTSCWTYDPFADLREYRAWLSAGQEYAILTLGGGVPRNWAQQIFAEFDGSQLSKNPRLISGVRICPDSAELGHLSGSSFSEARSWRKIRCYRPDDFVEVAADATLVFPLLAVAMLPA